MKELLKLLTQLHQDFNSANTPEIKKDLLEDAKNLAPLLLSGLWLELALFGINRLESTIVG